MADGNAEPCIAVRKMASWRKGRKKKRQQEREKDKEQSKLSDFDNGDGDDNRISSGR